MSLFRLHLIRTVLAALVLVLIQRQVATAQTPSWSAPLGGYVFDPLQHTIRPISGFVGSALLGAPVASGVEWVSLAPNQQSAILQKNRTQSWVPNLADSAQTFSLPHLPSARQAMWAADSSRAVLLTNAQIFWLTNFTSTPVAQTGWNLTGAASPARHGTAAIWTLLATDATADKVLLGAETAQGWQLWEASTTTAPVQVAVFARPVVAAFASTSSAAFIADVATNQVFRLTLGSTPPLTPLLSSATYVSHVSGIALSSDDARLFLADPSAKAVHVLSASNGAFLQDLSTSDAVGSITPVASGLFLLNSVSRSPQPFWFLDTSQPARVAFVPRGE